MITIGAFEAKTRLASLLDQVAAGEEVLITKHGKPVARLVGAVDHDQKKALESVKRLMAMRKGTTLGVSWKELRDIGRK
jgi:prevent-host-death family protein